MKSITAQLLDYLQANHGVFASGTLQKLEWRNKSGSTAVPRTIVRQLQHLAEQGKINVQIINNHAHYSAQPIPPPKKQVVKELPNGKVEISYV